MDASHNFVQTTVLALAGDTPLIPRYVWPFFVALLAGAGFGFLGHKKRNAGLLWGISGAFFGLVTAATAAGFANAITIPYTAAEMRHRQVMAFVFWMVMIMALAKKRRPLPADGAFPPP